MDVCNDRHEPVYRIVYKGAKGSDYNPEWLVCEACHEKKIFGTKDEIISIERLA